jgi:putative phosphoribosyl transferase
MATVAAPEVRIPVDGAGELEGELGVPRGARTLVAFAHGSGSSRHSRRNQFVAAKLREAGLGTLLFDLLSTEEEEVDFQTAHLRFDIPLLAGRLAAATEWIERSPELAGLGVAYFGASTGAAAALVAAARFGSRIESVVSRGGRPDLAGPELGRVQAPTLLVVGGRDEVVIELNREALARLQCEKELRIVPGATHLFEEPGALEEVARLAADWLCRHARRPAPGSEGSEES